MPDDYVAVTTCVMHVIYLSQVLQKKRHQMLQHWRKEGNVLFNDTLNTFYLRLYVVGYMVKDHSYSERGNPLSPYGLLTEQDGTYHSLCYTSCGALAGTRNSSMGPEWRIDPTTQHTMNERSYHRATSHSSIGGCTGLVFL